MAGQNGGAREGSGRKLTGRRKVNLYITEEEEKYLRAGLLKLREKENQKLNTNLILGGEEIKEHSATNSGKIMKMLECKHIQSWGNGVNEKPITGQTVWCAWCQKMEKIEKVY